MLYTTDWTAKVKVTYGPGDTETWPVRVKAESAAEARDKIRASVKREHGDEVKISVLGLKENIYDASH